MMAKRAKSQKSKTEKKKQQTIIYGQKSQLLAFSLLFTEERNKVGGKG